MDDPSAITVPARMGPEPLLISRSEVDALYEILAAVVAALDKLGVDYIVTGRTPNCKPPMSHLFLKLHPTPTILLRAPRHWIRAQEDTHTILSRAHFIAFTSLDLTRFTHRWKSTRCDSSAQHTLL